MKRRLNTLLILMFVKIYFEQKDWLSRTARKIMIILAWLYHFSRNVDKTSYNFHRLKHNLNFLIFNFS